MLRIGCNCRHPQAGVSKKQLPRRLRCSGLEALRSGAGLPPD